MKLAVLARALLVFSALSLAGCPRPIPGEPKTPGQVAIECTTAAVRDFGIPLIPKVNDCLTGEDWHACLISLINPAANITESILACVVRNSAQSFAEITSNNPKDAVSVKGMSRAREFIKERGYVFADTAPAQSAGPAGGGP